MQPDPSHFEATLQKFPGKGGWTFVKVPPELAPRERMAFGRCPVTASVDGNKWETSVWQDKSGMCMLAIPKKQRGAKEKGESVTVTITYPFQKVDPDNYRKYI